MVLYWINVARAPTIIVSPQRDSESRSRQHDRRRASFSRRCQSLRPRPALARPAERRLVNSLEIFVARLATAPAGDEPGLFAEAQRLFQTKITAPPASADAAIRLHRALLPDNGYQLGETAARRGLASSWRPDDPHILPFDAATPARALLRATAHALAKEHETERRICCGKCGGRGWTIARDGGRRICDHRTE